jgi:hypothetical protein
LRYLILRNDGTEHLTLEATRPGLTERAAVLETIVPPDAVLSIPGGLRAEAKPIKDMLANLRAKSRIDDQGAHPTSVRITGFLTWEERDQLVNAIAAVNIAAVPDAHKALPARGSTSKPTSPAFGTRQDPQRPPFFPIRSRPLARPRSATGASISGRTEWKEEPAGQRTVYTTTLNYEAAGFTDIPQVFAWLDRIPDEREPKGRPLFRGEIVDCSMTVKEFKFRLWSVTVTAPAGWFEPKPDAELLDYLREHLFVRWVALQSDSPAGGAKT